MASDYQEMTGKLSELIAQDDAEGIRAFFAGIPDEKTKEKLLKIGDVQNRDTLLHVAYQHRKNKARDVLISLGADPKARNLHKQTPAQAAEAQAAAEAEAGHIQQQLGIKSEINITCHNMENLWQNVKQQPKSTSFWGGKSHTEVLAELLDMSTEEVALAAKQAKEAQINKFKRAPNYELCMLENKMSRYRENYPRPSMRK